jgi:DNA-binding MarR family transcriptional regulator
VSLKRTAALFDRQVLELMKPFGVTPNQYNVLRILRGAGNQGLCRYEVSERLIAPDPDVTRLLDRLEKQGLVTRERDDHNRRLVKARITEKGLHLIDEMERPLNQLHASQFAHLDGLEIERLIDLLASARFSVADEV